MQPALKAAPYPEKAVVHFLNAVVFTIFTSPNFSFLGKIVEKMATEF